MFLVPIEHKMRLSKYLARHGVASRRECESIISKGRVKVEDQIISDPAFDVNEKAIVVLDGHALVNLADSKFTYIMLNKPAGVTSTMQSDTQNDLTIADLVEFPSRIFPVGRLDRNTVGLILLTDNGDLTNKLTRPGSQVKKEYVLRLQRSLSRPDLQKLGRGVLIDNRIVEVDDITILGKNRISIVIHEGRRHIIRRLFGALHHRILELKRVRIASLSLGRLSLGKWRKLYNAEIKALLEVEKSIG